MSRRNSTTVSHTLQARRQKKRNQRTIALVVSKIRDQLYFSGSHYHQMDGKHWTPYLKMLSRPEDRNTAITVAIDILMETTDWQLLHFIAVDTGDAVELFSFNNILRRVTYLSAPKTVMDLIDGTLDMMKQQIDEEQIVEGTKLNKHMSIVGFAYYLFNSTTYDVKGSEDTIADTLVNDGTFEHPFNPDEYQRLKPSDFSEFFTRQQQTN
ncbi:hypothetical protein [Vibrio phage VP4B]|uniref:Uncharacterized protein n=1 Tax=Vibrio phage VP4B TaxID=1262540 RepID=V9LZM0_9CAUD|nr:hypothetical protein FDJ61_gp180 [Vibrio phage VP4B]AGB07294.1 hypothetical protein [Vibrio phage VP4B]